MNPQLERQTNIFVLRIWAEYLTNDTPELRGEVEDLANHERHPFSGGQELEKLLTTVCLHEPSDRESTSEKKPHYGML